MHTGFWWGDMGGRDHLEDLGIDGRTVLKSILKTGCNDVDSIELAQNMDEWRAVVNSVMNLRGSIKHR